jgi:hypothetical protein
VTGLARSEVPGVDDNSVGHVGCFVGTGFGLFGGPAQGLTLERQATRVMQQPIQDGIGDRGVTDPTVPVLDG